MANQPQPVPDLGQDRLALARGGGGVSSWRIEPSSAADTRYVTASMHDHERRREQLDEEAAQAEPGELGRGAAGRQRAVGLDAVAPARRSSAGRRCRPQSKNVVRTPPGRHDHSCQNVSASRANATGIEPSRAARPRSAQIRTGRRRRRSTQAPATRPTIRVATEVHAPQHGHLDRAGTEDQDRASGSAIRVTSDPKIEIVAAVQRRMNAWLRQSGEANGLRTDGAAYRARVGRRRDHRPRHVATTLRYTPPASVRQNPRTTRTVAASARGRRATTIQPESGPGPCSTPSASACARPSARLTGRGRISEADVDAAMREVRLALLEADVNFKVVKDFIARVRERAIGDGRPREPDGRPAGRQDRQRRAGRAAARRRRSRPSTSVGQPGGRRHGRPPGLGQDDDRRPSSPATSSSRAAGRCSWPPTRTARPPRTSSRRSARPLDIPVYRAPAGHVGRRHRPRRASRPPGARSATSSSSTRPAG